MEFRSQVTEQKRKRHGGYQDFAHWQKGQPKKPEEASRSEYDGASNMLLEAGKSELRDQGANGYHY
jgi:hypothetical protein